MKKFLFKVSFFTSLLALVSVYSFWIVEEYYHSGSGYSEVDLSYDHYILADSHANALEGNVEKYGIHHFAYGSDSYIDMERKLSYLVKNTEVKTVFITINDQALSIYREQANNWDRSIQFATPENYSSYYEYSKVRYIERYVTLLNPKVRSLVRVYTQNLILEFINKVFSDDEAIDDDKSSENSTNNKIWTDFSKEERIQKAIQRFDYQFPSFNASEIMKKSLSNIIEISKNNDIRLIGIKYPLSNEFIQLKDGRNFSGAEMLMNAGYEVYNLENVYSDKQYKFYNQDHLNDNAGGEFAKIFNQILLKNR